jgi:PAS domain-containing protein
VRDQHGKVVFLLAEGRNIPRKKRAWADVEPDEHERQGSINDSDRRATVMVVEANSEMRSSIARILGADEEPGVRLPGESVRDYILRPCSIHELRARVRNQVNLKRKRDVSQAELRSQSTDLPELSQPLGESRSGLKRSLDRQKEYARLWHAVFENSAVAIGVLDLEGRFLEANPRLQSMTGNAQEGCQASDLTRFWSKRIVEACATTSPHCVKAAAPDTGTSAATDGAMAPSAGLS